MKSVKAKKSLGQNFLKDDSVIEHIFSVAEVGSKDWVFEVGPGTGALTHKLVGRVEKYLALELDHELAQRLEKQFVDSKKVTIIEGDILDIYLEKMLQDIGYTEHPYKIIANIPYYITAPIIRTLLSLSSQPQSMTLMVQDEVAERLSAEPGSMSLLSLMVQYYAQVKKQFFVPKESFDPMPKVESAVITIIPKRPYNKEEDRAVFRIARAGFSARRKTLANNLSTSFSISRETVILRLREVGLPEDVRAQALSVSDWERLTQLWPKSE